MCNQHISKKTHNFRWYFLHWRGNWLASSPIKGDFKLNGITNAEMVCVAFKLREVKEQSSLPLATLDETVGLLEIKSHKIKQQWDTHLIDYREMLIWYPEQAISNRNIRSEYHIFIRNVQVRLNYCMEWYINFKVKQNHLFSRYVNKYLIFF